MGDSSLAVAAAEKPGPRRPLEAQVVVHRIVAVAEQRIGCAARLRLLRLEREVRNCYFAWPTVGGSDLRRTCRDWVNLLL